MADDLVNVEPVAEGVRLVTLSLPERRNAMTEQLTTAWGAAVERLARDRDARAVVVTGAGRAFCAGGDLSWIAGDESARPDAAELRAKMAPFYRTWLSIRSLEVPVLAAVNGPAVGAGLCLALACDLRYGSPAARFSAPFTALGMHPGMAATYLLPEAVGPARARELLYTGRSVDADEAERIGLLAAVFPADRLVAEVVAIAARIAGTAPIAVRLTKAALNAGPRTLEEALEWEALAQPVTMATDDLREGLRAQAERRRPQFRGR